MPQVIRLELTPYVNYTYRELTIDECVEVLNMNQCQVFRKSQYYVAIYGSWMIIQKLLFLN